MILIMHNALGAEAQRLGPQGLQLTTMDLTLAAAKLTVMGTGKLSVSRFVRTCCGQHMLLVEAEQGQLKLVPSCKSH